MTPAGFFLCVKLFIGTYTLQNQQVDSCALLVSLCHTVHSVTASRGESLRGWEVFAVQRCTVPYYHLLVRLYTSVVLMVRGNYRTSNYLPTVGVLGARWYSFQRARCGKSM